MKKLTCKDLGGVCDEEFIGVSFEEIGQKCHEHVMAMIDSGDEAHKQAAEKMKNATPQQRQAMMGDYQQKYKDAPEF